MNIVAAGGWADVYAGSKLLCRTPCQVELGAGPHKLTFVRDDNRHVRTVCVEPDEVNRVRIQL